VEAKDFRGIYPEPAEGILTAESATKNILSLFTGLFKLLNNSKQLPDLENYRRVPFLENNQR